MLNSKKFEQCRLIFILNLFQNNLRFLHFVETLLFEIDMLQKQRLVIWKIDLYENQPGQTCQLEIPNMLLKKYGNNAVKKNFFNAKLKEHFRK